MKDLDHCFLQIKLNKALRDGFKITCVNDGNKSMQKKITELIADAIRADLKKKRKGATASNVNE